MCCMSVLHGDFAARQNSVDLHRSMTAAPITESDRIRSRHHLDHDAQV